MIPFLMTFWKKQNYRDKNQISGCQGAGSREEESIAKGNEGIFWCGGNVLYLVCVRGCMTVCLSK